MRAVTPLTPRMVRVTLAATGLCDFPVEQPGEIITLLWPDADGEVVLPEQGWRFPAGVPEPHARNYTVRSHDPAAGTLDVDFVVHGDHGIASAWAARATVGDRLGYAGPRTHWAAGDDGCAWTLLVADETGLPALAAIAETLPSFHRAIAVVEVADGEERQPISCAGKLDLRWVHRDGAPAGETLALADAVRALPLPDGRGRAWGAGESGVMRQVRDHLRDERGIPRADLHVLGYWKHDKTKEWTR
ncbi:SIP domain-containing protein [Conexibacter arvalis]|uniref:NADPH-dependent ferric siderophore reductase n=1 Tax=Conexibacter arvalis TaxID=912552 RepID=A0A840IGB3_9ACTN|nr:NADPH-dependent ferric siderophore reductase [Conexibacter arvalis]